MNRANDSRKGISLGWVITKVAIGAVSGAGLGSLMGLMGTGSFREMLVFASIGIVPGAVLYLIGAILYRLWGRRGFLIGVILEIFLLSAGVMILTSAFLYTWSSVNIEANQIPIYPRAQNVLFDEPASSTREIGDSSRLIATWVFTTSDDPEKVWRYYVGEMNDKWGFVERPLLPESPRTLIGGSCPTYLFIMTSTSIDATTNRITTRLSSYPCS